jgi:glycosyltransferase involved in cell wall biosynthesis
MLRKARQLIELVLFLPAVVTCAVRALRGLAQQPWPPERMLLYFSEVMWDEVWQRPQELATRLSQTIPTVYISAVQLHRWRFSLRQRWQYMRSFVAEGQRDLIVLSPLILPGHYRSRLIYKLNCWLLTLILHRWLKHSREIRCVTDSPFAWPVIDALFFCQHQRILPLAKLHYDIIDDFPAFEWAPAWAREYDAKLLDQADTVSTGTYELWHQRRVRRPDAEFIPCGVDYDAFNRPAGEIPPDLALLPEPRIGYFGSVSDRLDYDLIALLADKFPAASVVLVGPIRMDTSRLPRKPNIHYLGLKPHNELPRYAQNFTVALIPFLINEATAKLNPVKTLEYLAAGIPVVSTAIPDVVRFFSHTVLIARDREEFTELVRQAIDSPDIERIRHGVDLARSSSWNEVAHRIASRILGPSERRPPRVSNNAGGVA